MKINLLQKELIIIVKEYEDILGPIILKKLLALKE